MRSKGLILLLFLVCFRTTSAASCKKAHSDQIPHGANEIVVWTEQTVAHLQGTVAVGHADDPVRDVVVEIYRYESGEDALEITKFVADAKRTAACLTREDGRFAFKDLKPGRYLLRAGTVEFAGINELYAIFRVTGRGKTQDVEIRLSLGT